MEKDVSVSRGSSFKKEPLKKQLSFDEKVTEIRLMGLTNLDARNGDAEEESDNRRKGIRWWTPADDNTFANYCKSTSIHGLRYIGSEGMHFGERVLWTIVFVISAVVSAYFIKAVVDKYYDSPVTVTFDSSEMFIGDVPFPAVTICNMNRVLRSKAEQYIKLAGDKNDNDVRVLRARRNVYYLNHVCQTSNKPFSKFFNYTTPREYINPELLKKVHIKKDDEEQDDVIRFLQKASQPCEKMVKLCLWEGNQMACNGVFHPVLTTHGQCCVFNMIPRAIMNSRGRNADKNDLYDSEELLKSWNMNNEQPKIEDFLGSKYKFPRHQIKAGKTSGLSILVDPEMNEYFCTSADSTGFQVRIHFPSDVPHVSDFGIAIRPKYEHFVSVTPSVTIANDVVKSYSVEKRKCYFENERSLKYYKIYSATNCLDECVADLVYKECGCVRYYMPQDDTREICGPKNFSCADNVIQKTFASGVKQECENCYPTCTEIKYSQSVTMAPLETLDLWKDQNNQSPPWARKNVSIVNVYFGADSIYPRIRGQLFTLPELIANTGGLLGLCMGFSFLSLFEIIYHLTCRPWCHKKERKVNCKCDPESMTSPSPLNTNGLKGGNGLHPDGVIAEARRVHMKPGDDGLYHLQKTPQPSSPPLYAKSVIPEDVDEETETEVSKETKDVTPVPMPSNEEDMEDSHL